MIPENTASFSEEELSKLGFGCMRFIGREDNTIDIDYTCEMIDRYLAAGGNYFDTSWVYPNSEATLKKAGIVLHRNEMHRLGALQRPRRPEKTAEGVSGHSRRGLYRRVPNA